MGEGENNFMWHCMQERILGMASAKNLWFESSLCLLMRPLMCVNVFTSCEGALPLSNLLEICLQKASILCMSLRVSFWSVTVRDAFTLSLVDVGVVSVDVVSAVLHVLLQVQVAEPSGVNVTNILIEGVGTTGIWLTSTNHERQSAALWAPDIKMNWIL